MLRYRSQNFCRELTFARNGKTRTVTPGKEKGGTMEMGVFPPGSGLAYGGNAEVDEVIGRRRGRSRALDHPG
jgi:hypothetical protein